MNAKRNQRKPNKRKAKVVVPTLSEWRPTAVLSVIGLAFLILIVRAVDLQVMRADFLTQRGNSSQLVDVELSAHRGPITDRKGRPLAVSTPVDSIWANPQELAQASDRINELAEALERKPERLLQGLSQHLDRKFIYLRRHMTPTQAQSVLDLGLPGVYAQREYRRYYPAGEVSGHVLGFTNVDDQGQEGLELAFDGWLRGHKGKQRVMRDRLGRIIADVESLKPARPGKPLTTSLDLDIQYMAYRELKRAVNLHNAKSGSVVVMKVGTGEVLAMANQPSYNPNDRSQLTVARYRNRAVTDIFEPGSSFKPFIAAAALETGQYRGDTQIETSPGKIRVGQKVIRDIKNYGTLTMGGVLKESSNVGIVQVALSLPADRLWGVLAGLGFGSLTTSGFPGESAGLLNSYEHWRPIGQATLAYGYGLSVTPLQLAQAYSTIGASGMRHPVTFLRMDEVPGSERVLRANTAAELVKMLETVVEPDGTGWRAKVDGYRVIGKTGTARKFEAGGYSDLRHVAAFAGLAPASDPQLAVVVVIDEPGGDEYYGGQVAAPVFSRVMGSALRLLAIAPDRPATMSPDQILTQHTPDLPEPQVIAQ
ncbi:MAG: peptidoglycan D,D-transpeptidase FtsI family protein [Gammaproteobacteria bacterium]